MRQLIRDMAGLLAYHLSGAGRDNQQQDGPVVQHDHPGLTCELNQLLSIVEQNRALGYLLLDGGGITPVGLVVRNGAVLNVCDPGDGRLLAAVDTVAVSGWVQVVPVPDEEVEQS